MTRTSFRILVIITFLIGVAGMVAEFATDQFLPETLREYRKQFDESEMSPRLLAVAFAGLSIFVLWIVGTIGLLFLWRPARILYTLANILAFPISIAFGPVVQHEATAFLTLVSTFLGGIIWALIYFSPIKDYFERPAESAAL